MYRLKFSGDFFPQWTADYDNIRCSHFLSVSDEAALEDFKIAAGLGSEFAKQQAILLNPIAALCNSMMTEMIQKVREGEMI